MNLTSYSDERLYSQFKDEQGTTLLGGTVHVFRSCVRSIEDCAFCLNAGVPLATNLAPRGALYVESPDCALNLTRSYFEANEVLLDGGAMQARAARKLLTAIADGTFVQAAYVPTCQLAFVAWCL